MTPHEWDALATVLSVAALVTCIRLGWVWGRARLRADLVPDLNRRLDAAYDEGWDDAVSAQARQGLAQAQGAPDATRPDYGAADETPTVLIPAGVRSSQQRAVGLSDVQKLPARLPEMDWLTATHEQLSPEHIQDTPDPVQLTPRRAGGLQWWEEAPLPAVLGLGQEFSGDDKTYARWQVRRWEFRRQCGLDSIEAA